MMDREHIGPHLAIIQSETTYLITLELMMFLTTVWLTLPFEHILCVSLSVFEKCLPDVYL